jgi:hypothetical protein
MIADLTSVLEHGIVVFYSGDETNQRLRARNDRSSTGSWETMSFNSARCCWDRSSQFPRSCSSDWTVFSHPHPNPATRSHSNSTTPVIFMPRSISQARSDRHHREMPEATVHREGEAFRQLPAGSRSGIRGWTMRPSMRQTRVVYDSEESAQCSGEGCGVR